MLPTPPRPLPSCHIEEAPETPDPIRARINNLQGQVTELVRREHAATRRHKAEISSLESTIAKQGSALKESNSTLAVVQNSLTITHNKLDLQTKMFENEIEKCRSEGETMRDELNLHSTIQQHKALLSLAQEQMQMVELEQRLVQAETARIMRDYKISLFQVKEDDLVSELAGRDARLEELEASLAKANTSLAHRKAADSKANQSKLSDTESELVQARAEIINLHSQIDKLEISLKGLREKEREARAELDDFLQEERGKAGSLDKEKRELQIALRAAKSELRTKTEELSDLQDELTTLKETSQEREKALKAKYREANEEKARLAGIELELDSIKHASKAKPTEKIPSKTVKEKVRKTSPVDDEESEQEVMPKKKAKKPEVTAAVSDGETPEPKTKKTSSKSKPAKSALLEASDNVGKLSSKRQSPDIEEAPVAKKKLAAVPDKNPAATDETEGEAAPEKKKKRKLFATQANFTWDPIMNSADGVIPAYLSPVKTAKGGTIGAIPRIGFPSVSSRALNRF